MVNWSYFYECHNDLGIVTETLGEIRFHRKIEKFPSRKCFFCPPFVHIWYRVSASDRTVTYALRGVTPEDVSRRMAKGARNSLCGEVSVNGSVYLYVHESVYLSMCIIYLGENTERQKCSRRKEGSQRAGKLRSSNLINSPGRRAAPSFRTSWISNWVREEGWNGR